MIDWITAFTNLNSYKLVPSTRIRNLPDGSKFGSVYAPDWIYAPGGALITVDHDRLSNELTVRFKWGDLKAEFKGKFDTSIGKINFRGIIEYEPNEDKNYQLMEYSQTNTRLKASPLKVVSTTTTKTNDSYNHDVQFLLEIMTDKGMTLYINYLEFKWSSQQLTMTYTTINTYNYDKLISLTNQGYFVARIDKQNAQLILTRGDDVMKLPTGLKSWYYDNIESSSYGILIPMTVRTQLKKDYYAVSWYSPNLQLFKLKQWMRAKLDGAIVYENVVDKETNDVLRFTDLNIINGDVHTLTTKYIGNSVVGPSYGYRTYGQSLVIDGQHNVVFYNRWGKIKVDNIDTGCKYTYEPNVNEFITLHWVPETSSILIEHKYKYVMALDLVNVHEYDSQS